MNNINEKLAQMSGGEVIAIDVPADGIMRANVEIIKNLHAQGYVGVYIALSKNYQELAQIFDYAGIDKTKLYIVDGISNVYGSALSKLPNVKYVDSPSAIKTIDGAVKDFLDTIQGDKKFVLLDSATVLLLYNSFEQVVSLCGMLSERAKKDRSVCIIMSLFLGVPNKKMSEGLVAVVDEFVSFS